MRKTNRTYTVVFMEGDRLAFRDKPLFFRQYKNKEVAKSAIREYGNKTGWSAFIIKGDARASHKRKVHEVLDIDIVETHDDVVNANT